MGRIATCAVFGFFLLIAFCAESSGGENKWTTSGPFGGKFESFAFHPQNSALIFASADNALFRSKNSGKNWERLQIAGESLVVRIHPRNSETVIAAGFSVFKSTNQGTDWERISAQPFVGERLSDMEFDPSDPQILYALTFRAGLFKSNDGGRTWTRTSSGLDLSGKSGNPQLEIDPKNGRVLYALLRSKKIFKSVNAAESWKSFSAGLAFNKNDSPGALAIDPKNPNVLYSGSDTTIFKTMNGGAQWSALNCDCKVARIAVDPNNPNVVFVSGSQLSKSTNAGASWREIRVNATLANTTIGIGVHPRTRNLLLVGGEGGGIFRSQTGGGRFNPSAKRLNAFVVHHVESHPQTPNRIFAQGDQQVFLSSNAGKSWNVIAPLSQSIVRDIAIHPKNPNLIVAVGQFPESHTVALSLDGGKNWKYSGPSGVTISLVVALDPSNENTYYVAPATTCAPQVVKTTDQGKTWRKLLPSAGGCGSVPSIAIDPKDSLIVFVGSNPNSGNFYRSVDGGLRWKKIFPKVGIGSITSITFDPRDSRIVYITGDDSFGILRSTNGGTKWDSDSIVTNYADRVSGLPNCIYGAGLSGSNQSANVCGYDFIAFDPDNPDIVYAAGYPGLFISTDRGQKWSAFDSNGLGSAAIRDLLFHPSGMLSLGTDQGVYSFSRAAAPGGPSITQLAPSSGKIGDLVRIIGNNFGNTRGSGEILFSGASTSDAESWTDSAIEVQVPPGVVTGTAAVRTSSGNTSNPFQFIVLAPSNNPIEPSSGASSGGTKVAIVSPHNLSGTQFNVLFGSALAKDVGFTGPNIVTCTSPPGTGTVEVELIFGAGSVKVGAFTYN